MSGTLVNNYFQDHCEVTEDLAGTVSFLEGWRFVGFLLVKFL